MLLVPVNYLAIIVSAIASIVVAALWYSPLLFGARYQKLANRTPEQASGSPQGYVMTLIAFLLTAYLVAHAVHYVNVQSVTGALGLGFMLWLGFDMTTRVVNTIFDGRPVGLLLIHGGYHLLQLLMISTILTLWR